MTTWQKRLKFEPTKSLLSSDNKQIIYFTNRDLLEVPVESIETLWDLKIPQQLLHKQQTDGSWRYRGKTPWHTTDYTQLETYRQLGFQINMFGFNKSHQSIVKAAEFFFLKQSNVGDFRGIYAAQYSPNYTAAIVELLILAGYSDDNRIQKVFDWLLDMRQDDGGWALPLRTKGHNLKVILNSDTIEPDKSTPFSHLITGIVLRAFAAHPVYSRSAEAKKAGKLLSTRFFQRDVYADLNRATAWRTFSYPFWNTDLISSLYVLSKLGFTKDDPEINRVIDWLVEKQKPSGLFELHKNHDRYHDQDLWLNLSICRVLKKLY